MCSLIYIYILATTIAADSLFQARPIIQVESPDHAQGNSSKSLAL
ncbi:hypothetical protein GLYMA_02G155550v4 [Glycine max]|nr:hypothetical protein GLYMA_02G155550v4 [Glycine max]KAH1060517.1 hypothetical protein GYH30_004131 [Glycine max]